MPKNITPTLKLSKTSYVYNGKAQKPTVAVYDGKTKLDASNYTVSYANGRKAVGTYKVTVTLKGNYSGTGTASFKITKAAQPMKVATKAKTVKLNKVKKSAQTVTGAITVTKPQGTVSYTKVAKGSDKNMTINKKNGKIVVKKGTKKGKHKLIVNVKAAGNANYKALTKKVTVTITVK